MHDMQEPVIEVRNLRVDFPGRHGTVTALSDVSLSIRPGEILGVVGESGAGKSMTGLAIQGLLEAPGHIADGEVWLGKRRIDTLDDRAMEKIRGREIGAIFQDPLTSLNPLFTVGAQLVETIRRHLGLGKAQARERAIQLLRDVGIPSPEDRVNQYPHQFSGGMRQRVVIALALAASPKLVIADEPTTALDVSIQAQIISLLRKLCKEKQTAVMLVTHDMGVIAEAADRIAVMYAGRLIEIGPVEQVLHQPRHPYTQGLMASIPSLGARVEKLNQIDGSMPRLDAIPKGCAFNPRCKVAVSRCLEERPELNLVSQKPNLGASACWLNAGGTV
ncbi:ABC transporter ATP-binding protein [Ochrobactrum sp. GPK 3]